MLKIRLSRTGKKNSPTYSILVVEKSKPARTGAFKEKIGYYLPTRKEAVLEFDQERLEYWIGKGAKPSETLARLLHKEKVKGMDKFFNLKKVFKKASNNPEQEEQAAPAVEEAQGEGASEEATE